MKKLTILICIIIPFCAIAQHNFKTIDSKIVWETIFEDTISSPGYFDFIKTKAAFIDSNYDGNMIYGDTQFIDLIKDNSKLAIYARYDVAFNYKIEFKDSRYKVLLYNFQLDSTSGDEDLPLDDLLVKNRDGSLRTAKTHLRYYERLHDSLIKLFTYKKEESW